MRIYIKTSPNRHIVPFNYQANLVGAFHKWLGENAYHDGLSLYSLSWLEHGKAAKDGLNFPEGGTFFVSSPEIQLIKRLIDGMRDKPEIAFGMHIRELILRPTPQFSGRERFHLQSPVLIKREIENTVQFFFPEDSSSDQYLTETMKHKMRLAGIEEPIHMQFDPNYLHPRKKLIDYKGIKNKGTLCPVIIEGSPEAIGFAWDVGIGNSTGIGFGAIR